MVSVGCAIQEPVKAFEPHECMRKLLHFKSMSKAKPRLESLMQMKYGQHASTSKFRAVLMSLTWMPAAETNVALRLAVSWLYLDSIVMGTSLITSMPSRRI